MFISRPSSVKRVHICTALAIATIGATALSGRAGDIFYGNVGTDLSVPANWVGTTEPTLTDVGVFDTQDAAQLALTLGAPVTWQGIRVANPGGSLTIAASNLLTLDTAGIDMSAATVDFTMLNTVALNSAQIWNVAAGRNLTASGVVSGGVSLTKSGGGSLILGAANTTFTGGLIQNDGVTKLTLGTSAGTGAITLFGGTLTAGAVAIANQLNITGNVNLVSTGTIVLTGAWSGSGTLNYSFGANQQDITTGSSAFFTGFTGVLNLGASTGLVRIGGSNTTGGVDYGLINATVNLGTSTARIQPRNMSTQSIGALIGGVGTRLDSQQTAGSTNLVTWSIGALGVSTTFDGRINQGQTAGTTSGLAKVGTGKLTLTGTASNYSGTADIQNGTLSLTSINGLGTTSATTILSLGSAAAASATLQTNITVGGTTSLRPFNLNGSGVIEVASGTFNLANSGVTGGTAGSPNTLTLTGASTGVNSFGPSLSDVGGGTSLVKNGSTTWILANTSGNAYTGATAVNQGTLVMNGTFSSSSVSVASGATLSPATGVGTVGLNNLTLAAGSTLNYEFGLGGNDQINLNGTSLNLNASITLNLFQVGSTSAYATNGTYNLFTNLGTLSGVPTNLVTGNPVGGGATYAYSQVGSNIVLTIAGALVANNWNVNGGGSWGTAGSWTDHVPNSQGDTANFLTIATSGNPVVTLDGSRTVGSLVFNDSAASYTIAQGTGGGSLIIDNGATAATITVLLGSHTISAPVTLNTSAGTNIVLASNTLTLSGAVGGANGITISGSGQLNLTNTNTYAGGTTIGGNDIVELDGTGNFGNGGTVTNGGSITLNHSDAYNLNNVFAGAGVINKNGVGTVTFSGVGSTRSGATNINVGKVVLGPGSSLGTGSIVIAASSLLDVGGNAITTASLSGSGTVDNSGASTTLTLKVPTGTSATWGGIIENSGGPLSVQLSGTGVTNGGSITFMLPQTYTGQTIWNNGTSSAGTMVMAVTDAISPNSQIVMISTNQTNPTGPRPITLNDTVVLHSSINIRSAQTAGNGEFLGVASGSATYTGNVTLLNALGTSAQDVTNSAIRVGSGSLSSTITLTGNISGQATAGPDASGVSSTIVNLSNGNIILNGATVNSFDSEFLLGRNTVGANIILNSGTSITSNVAAGEGGNMGGNNAQATPSVIVTMNSNTQIGVGARSFNLNNGGAATTTTLTMNAGSTLTAGSFTKTAAGATTVNLNGGVIAAGASSTAFLPAATALTMNVQTGGAVINNGGFAITVAANFTGSAGDGGYTQTGAGSVTLTGANTWQGPTNVTGGNLIIGGNGVLPTNTALNLSAGSTVSLTSGMGAIKLSSLSIPGTATAPTGVLDLKNAGLVLAYPDAATGSALAITTYKQVLAARGVKDNNGISDYSGQGITSSTASVANHAVSFEQFGLGVINNADLATVGINASYTTFLGQTGLTANVVLARYTYLGDINLDGKINIDDYNYIDDGFAHALDGKGLSGQILGDFNNDGVINIDDYNVIDSGFATQTTPLSDGGLTGLGGPAVGLSAVPEPTSLLMLGLGAAGLLARRRRR